MKSMITEKQMKSAVKKYNDIMEILGYEYATIGTSLSEDTEAWNLRDMVAECDYVLSTYYEDGHCNCEMRYSDDEGDRKMWVSHVGMLKRFIKHWEPYINDMKCAGGHCSRYDNHKDHKKNMTEDVAKGKEDRNMTTIEYEGKALTLDYDAQLDNYQDGVAFYATAHDESGNEYEIRWDYVEPDWYVNEEETPVNNDLSDFADWDHPAEVTEL